MEALVVFVVMHCAVPEVLIVDTPTEVVWDEVTEDERERAVAFIARMKEQRARVVTIEVKDDKCAIST